MTSPCGKEKCERLDRIPDDVAEAFARCYCPDAEEYAVPPTEDCNDCAANDYCSDDRTMLGFMLAEREHATSLLATIEAAKEREERLREAAVAVHDDMLILYTSDILDRRLNSVQLHSIETHMLSLRAALDDARSRRFQESRRVLSDAVHSAFAPALSQQSGDTQEGVES